MGARLTMATLVTLAAHSATARGAELPRYDVSGHCGRIALVAGSARSAEMREACERREQAAHQALSEVWPTLSPAAQGRCLWAARTHGENYDVLGDCVRLERAAEERRRRWGR